VIGGALIAALIEKICTAVATIAQALFGFAKAWIWYITVAGSVLSALAKFGVHWLLASMQYVRWAISSTFKFLLYLFNPSASIAAPPGKKALKAQKKMVDDFGKVQTAAAAQEAARTEDIKRKIAAEVEVAKAAMQAEMDRAKQREREATAEAAQTKKDLTAAQTSVADIRKRLQHAIYQDVLARILAHVSAVPSQPFAAPFNEWETSIADPDKDDFDKWEKSLPPVEKDYANQNPMVGVNRPPDALTTVGQYNFGRNLVYFNRYVKTGVAV
jgi:hypothetical protein